MRDALFFQLAHHSDAASAAAASHMNHAMHNHYAAIAAAAAATLPANSPVGQPVAAARA